MEQAHPRGYANEFDQGDEDEFPADRGPRGMRGRGPPPRPTVPDRTYEELDLKQNGRAFSPQEAYQQENGVFTRTLPETIKSAVIIQFLQADFYGGHHGGENVFYQAFVRQQCGAGGLLADLLGGATHVDVDDLGAERDVVLGRGGQLGRFAASYLH